MSKMKSNNSALKRFKKTGKGGFKHRASNRAHINTKMSTKRKRHLRGMRQVSKSDTNHVNQMVPKI
jgi:large subunit ribosomal protein L35